MDRPTPEGLPADHEAAARFKYALAKLGLGAPDDLPCLAIDLVCAGLSSPELLRMAAEDTGTLPEELLRLFSRMMLSFRWRIPADDELHMEAGLEI